MPLHNVIVSHFDGNEQQQIQMLINQLRDLFRGKLVQLSPEDRQRYGSVHEEQKKFVNKVNDYRLRDPNNMSPDVNWQEFDADYFDRRLLEGAITDLNALLYDLESTKMLHDYDNLQDARKEYRFVKYKASVDGEGAIPKLKEYQQFHEHATKGSSEENNTASTVAED